MTEAAEVVEETRPTARGPWWEYLGVVIAVVLLCALAGYVTYSAAKDDTVKQFSGSDGDPAKIGSTYTGLPDGGPAYVSTLRVPTGTLQLTVYDGYDRVENDDGDDFTAPSGGVLVGVDAVVDATTTTIPSATANYRRAVYPEVKLIAGGREYAVEGRRARPVAVPGATSGLALQVTFDGISQRLDPVGGKVSSGRAAALYGSLPITTTDCGRGVIAAPFVASSVGLPLTCRVTSRRLPWLPNLGWAPAGSAWLVAAISTRGPQVLDRETSSKVTQFVVSDFKTPLTVRCDSSAALVAVPGSTRLPLFAQPAGHRRDGTSYVACKVPVSGLTGVTLGITETVEHVIGPGDSDDTSARFSWSVPLK